MNFFWTKNDLEAWLKAAGKENDPDVYAYNLDEAIEESYYTFEV
ncbi:hypothetical protein CLOHIR_01831 [Peptacetobacter hiranonis DSM 13275]|uniref:Uncharacterized protein n=3 Tax=Peptostreptococcaceae TaxID=186804 RepID=B6G125_PEPHT|nr:hypothetical protein CLOHIR_01831 [Peptacetobacter hiranonis DSM 13275]